LIYSAYRDIIWKKVLAIKRSLTMLTNNIVSILSEIERERRKTPVELIVPVLFYRRTFSVVERVLEARDPYTEHHSERVAAMTQEMCRLLWLPPLQSQIIDMTAAIHDIGKVGISDAVLHKNGPLNDEEWSEIRQHPEIGAHILLAADELDIVADGVLHHHERWDGSGYPARLSGEDIPLSARIIAICDSVDAMKSDRPYRKALSDEVCKKELQKNSGVMYQPELVKIFLDNWDSIAAPQY